MISTIELSSKLIYHTEDIMFSMAYNHNKKPKINYNFPMLGQLKLLFNEIRFLSEDVNITQFKQEKITLLYIGSGKGYHIPLLIDYYKEYNIDWHLYDPNQHCDYLYILANGNLKNKLFIHDRFFTEDDIITFKNLKSILLFISDIRTVDENEKEPKTKNLLNDYNLQNKILMGINPTFSLIKFRMPFPDDWKDNYSFQKPIGKEYIQAFSKSTSTEFRIFLNYPFTFEEIKEKKQLIEYEEKYAWYNNEYRFQKDNDFKIILQILNIYLQKNNKYLKKLSDIKAFINHISKQISNY